MSCFPLPSHVSAFTFIRKCQLCQLAFVDVAGVTGRSRDLPRRLVKARHSSATTTL